jgi:hypothetical protein
VVEELLISQASFKETTRVGVEYYRNMKLKADQTVPVDEYEEEDEFGAALDAKTKIAD